MTTTKYSDRKAYADHISSPEWKPLVLPKSWNALPAHQDSGQGISLLRENYTVVALSNGPVKLLSSLSKHNGIDWDWIVPLELKQVFKPNPQAYLTVCEVFGVEPQEVCMVTANQTFGDLEASSALGMQNRLIRVPSLPDIVALYEELVCGGQHA